MRGCITLAIVMCACGGAPADVPSPAADAAAPDVPLDAPTAPSTCPSAPPDEGSACASDANLVCEYGSAESPSCDALFVCAAKQCTSDPPTWHQVGLTKTCPIAPPAGCASTFAQEASGDAGACVPCDYAEGVCFCGGNCKAAPSSCATLASRPRLGTACNAPSDSCPFQFDEVPLMLGCSSYACVDGVWRVDVCNFSLAPWPC